MSHTWVVWPNDIYAHTKPNCLNFQQPRLNFPQNQIAFSTFQNPRLNFSPKSNTPTPIFLSFLLASHIIFLISSPQLIFLITHTRSPPPHTPPPQWPPTPQPPHAVVSRHQEQERLWRSYLGLDGKVRVSFGSSLSPPPPPFHLFPPGFFGMTNLDHVCYYPNLKHNIKTS